MIIDRLNEFASAQALTTGSTAIKNIGSSIDLGSSGGDPAVADGLYLVIIATADVTGGSVQFKLVSDGESSIAEDSTPTLHMQTASIPTTDMTAGSILFVGKLPEGGDAKPYERYLGVQQLAGANLTAGRVDAFLTKKPPAHRSYADGAPALA